MRKEVIVKKYIQVRAENIKGLKEQREDLLSEMKELIGKAEEEQRALSEEEESQFNELDKKIKSIDATLSAHERAMEIEKRKTEKEDEGSNELTVEERAFVSYIRGTAISERSDSNLTLSGNGALIPTSIVNKIIEKVVDICPIYAMSDKYSVGGTIQIPYYDESAGKIEMAYADEFSELESKSGSYKSIELKGFLAGALTKVSKSLINNSDFNVLNKVIEHMALAISKFIERECLIGTDGKATGLLKGTTQIVTSASATKITADELIDVQEKVPDVYQSEAVWIMNKKTRTSIRKLKDNDGNYLLNRDLSAKWGYTLLGKDVFCSDNMPEMEAGKDAIVYGDMSGLSVKVSENPSVEVLREKYATQHAIGVVAWMELDTKVSNAQKVSKLTMASV